MNGNNHSSCVRFLVLVLVCLLNNTIIAQETKDSLLVKELDEVVVSAPNIIKKGESSAYYPNSELKRTTKNASQVIAGLQIPELIVDLPSGTISTMGKENLLILINGRPVSQNELATISSKDIVKVEYISNPGVRYKNYDAVVDISVKKQNEGYGAMLNLLQSLNRGWGNYVAALKYNIGKSEWKIDYKSNPMWDMDCYRNNFERIILEDGTEISRTEEGLKTPSNMVTHHGSLQYSYVNGNKIMFNAQARIIRRNDRYVSKGDITTLIGTESSTDFEQEVNPVKTWQGDLDLYFHWKINRNNKIYINLIPSIITSNSNRNYNVGNTSIDSEIDNNGWRLYSEFVWEHKFPIGSISAGMRSVASWSKIKYFPQLANIKERESNNYAFVEWRHRLNKIQYNIGLGTTYYNITNPNKYNSVYFNPRVFVRYAPVQWGNMSLTFNEFVVGPTMAQLSPVKQQIDTYQVRMGNTSLTPYHRFEGHFDLDFTFKNISMKVVVGDEYSKRPILSHKTYDFDKILQTYSNTGYCNHFYIKGQLTTKLFLKELSLSLEGGWHTMKSNGVNYSHSYRQPFINAQLMYMKGNWWVMAKYNNAYNRLWGESITTVNNNLLNLGVGYSYRNATFMAGIVNPIGKIGLKSSDLSEIAGFERTYHVSSSERLLWVGVSLNIFKGVKRSEAIRKLNNSQIYETINDIRK